MTTTTRHKIVASTDLHVQYENSKVKVLVTFGTNFAVGKMQAASSFLNFLTGDAAADGTASAADNGETLRGVHCPSAINAVDDVPSQSANQLKTTTDERS